IPTAGAGGGIAAISSRPCAVPSLTMSTASDDTLLASFALGDADAAAAFIRRYQGRVYGLARSMVGDAYLAEDVAQEAFIRAGRPRRSLARATPGPRPRRPVWSYCGRDQRDGLDPVGYGQDPDPDGPGQGALVHGPKGYGRMSLTCAELQELASELALGTVSG